jgi:hypothetical protein
MDPEANDFPFLTREMLKFGSTAALSLEVAVWTFFNGPFFLSGITREGLVGFSFEPAGNGSQETFTFNVVDVPVNLVCHVGTQTLLRGDMWVVIYLRVNGQRVAKMMSGFVSTQTPLSWPQTSGEEPQAGRGSITSNEYGTHAAGAELSYTKGDNSIFRVRALNFTLVTDANAANRRVHLLIKDTSGSDMYRFFSSVDHPASTTKQYFFIPGADPKDEEDNGKVIIGIPYDILIHPDMVIATVTTNRQAGDDFSGMRMQSDAFFTPET